CSPRKGRVQHCALFFRPRSHLAGCLGYFLSVPNSTRRKRLGWRPGSPSATHSDRLEPKSAAAQTRGRKPYGTATRTSCTHTASECIQGTRLKARLSVRRCP